MPIVTFLPSEKKIEVPQGTTVLQAEQMAGIRQDAPCGGHGRCGKCKVLSEGKEVLACRTEIRNDLTVSVLTELSQAEILAGGIQSEIAVQPVHPGSSHFGVDIGTTTVVLYMMDGVTGEILGTESMLNPQFPYGADVISRIQAAMGGHMQELSRLIRNGVWSLIEKLCMQYHKSISEIGTVAIAANPAMQQLFFGSVPDNLSKPPFKPHFVQTQAVALSDVFTTDGDGKLLIIPDIAGYVGADTMGCILSTGIHQDERMTLLIDIGTNGEMVLGNSTRMAACSTAAGPALEGGRISCGMRGSIGAIDHVRLKDGYLQFSVIGEQQPTGICGSGIIDAAAAMLDAGILNKRGRIQKEYREEGKERIYDLTDTVSLTQNDIREIQMAKGAIAAGIEILMKYLNVTVEEIDRVILCGAFGTYMNPESACRIGLLPEGLSGKITAGGNAAGMGSIQMALDREKFYLTDAIREQTEAVELASFPEFQRIYAANMMFVEA